MKIYIQIAAIQEAFQKMKENANDYLEKLEFVNFVFFLNSKLKIFFFNFNFSLVCLFIFYFKRNKKNYKRKGSQSQMLKSL
jgi:hypothetical protein